MTEPTPPSRSPDAADLALAKIVVPRLSFHLSATPAEILRLDAELAQALAAWLAARGIY